MDRFEQVKQEPGIEAWQDDMGGVEALLTHLEKNQSVRRYILTGGDFAACLNGVFDAIISRSGPGPLEVYFANDAMFNYTDSKAKVEDKMLNFITAYYGLGAKLSSAAIWLDDQLVATTSHSPRIRIRFYSTTQNMIAALS